MNIQARDDRLVWDDHHMLLALVTSQRSPDPNTQVGACLVNQENRVIGLGYNSFPRGISITHFPWERSCDDPCKTKYPFVVHAEKNAIYNSSNKTTDTTLFVTLFPCNECAKDIIQAGIKSIVYLEDKYTDAWQTRASKAMLDYVDIPYRKHIWSPSVQTAFTNLQTLFLQS